MKRVFPLCRSVFGLLALGVATWPALVCAEGLARGLTFQPAPPTFVSIRGFAAPAEREALCGAVVETLQLSGALDVPETCAGEIADLPGGVLEKVRASGRYALHVQVEVTPAQALMVLVEEWKQDALRGVPALSWTVPAEDNPAQQRMTLKELLRDALRGRTPFGIVLDNVHAQDAGDTEYGAVALEMGTYLTIGTVWYVMDTATNAPDQQYDWSWETLGVKLTSDGFAFDDNSLYLNSPGHPMAGMMYYLSGRSHRLGMLGAFVTAVAGTLAWEYAAEFREAVSINDLVFTPVGGFALGEPMYQLSRFFAQSQDTPVNRWLAAIFQGPSSLSPWPTGPSAPRARLLDEHGFARGRWRRIEVGAGVDTLWSRPEADVGGWFGLSSELILRENYELPGNSASAVIGPVATWLDAEISFGSRGMLDTHLRGEVAYGGFVVRTSNPAISSSWYAGLAAAYVHDERLLLSNHDRVAFAAPAGPVVHVSLQRGRMRLRSTGSAYPLFAGMTSHAVSTAPSLTGHVVPDMLREQGYHWGAGLEMRIRSELDLEGFELGGELRSLAVTGVNDEAFDRRSTLAAWASVPFPNRVRLTFRVEQTERTGTLGTLSSAHRDLRMLTQLGARF